MVGGATYETTQHTRQDTVSSFISQAIYEGCRTKRKRTKADKLKNVHKPKVLTVRLQLCTRVEIKVVWSTRSSSGVTKARQLYLSFTKVEEQETLSVEKRKRDLL